MTIEDKFENSTTFQGNGKTKRFIDGRTKYRKRKITNLSVKKLLNASEKELQEIYIKYDDLLDNPDYSIPEETRKAMQEEYERIISHATTTSFNDPYKFYKISRNLHRINSIGCLTNKGIHQADKKAVIELNRFISKIPKENEIKLIFNRNPSQFSWNLDSRYLTKKSRIVSTKDIRKDFVNLLIKVNSPEREKYSFLVKDQGYIGAEMFHDYIKTGQIDDVASYHRGKW